MTTPARYLELCELAYCGPDSPWIHEPRDRDAQVAWLQRRLAAHHVDVATDEVRAAMDAFTTQRPKGGTTL